MHYPQPEPKPDFPKMEERILESWMADGTFEASVNDRPTGDDGANEYVFYDGPPFANGLPHYGHLVTGYVKDVIPRYQTMRGKRVPRRFGWDCHGMPAEMEAENQLGFKGRLKILEYGVAEFNETCRTSVMKYTREWESVVSRQARWVDFKNDYKTMDLPYMESVIWAFKTLHDKGLVYEGSKVQPYSWAMESPVSNFETRMDNSYRERQDPALTVAFKLASRDGDPGEMHVLAWTTTPWTLPSNLALAVGPDLDYAVYREGDKHYVLAAAAAARYEGELKGAEQVASFKGSELVGRTYEPLFPYFADTENAFRILSGDFISTEDGTGVVHMAPGFGEDDHRVCTANDIPVLCPVDDRGRFTKEVSDYTGELVFDANKPIIKRLKNEGKVVKHETYLHNYPHCWRTDEPLIYKAISSWFLNVPKIRDRMVEHNQSINWIPGHVKDGAMGKWLEGAREWALTRNRFWGAPIPVWKSDDPDYPRIDVYGSCEELERDFGVKVTDLHRPAIDGLTRPNPDDPTGKSTMRRVEDVLDCWFESGSMPYAQVHYPFENREWFEKHFPADFIVEYIAQTRGWFYTLIVLSTALFDRPPFRNCICHGVVLDENNQKLSKKLRNYPPVEEVFDKYGSDALRWYLVSSPILRGQNLSVDSKGKGIAEIVRLAINPLWNAYSFFCLYANADKVKAEARSDSKQLLDRYILSKTRELIEQMTERMDSYDIPGACQTLSAFMDALNNWYIRGSRERFWNSDRDPAKVDHDAYATLYTVLTTVMKVGAPLLPLVTEEIYRGLTGEKSVHLADWPDPESLPADHDLVAEMDRIREICSAGLGIRKENDLRSRLPLATLTVAGEGTECLEKHFDLVKKEVNVKNVVRAERLEDLGDFVLKVNARAVGPRLGGKMKEVMGAANQGKWESRDDGTVEVAGETLNAEEFELRLQPKEGFASQALSGNRAIVALDTNVTPELEREGTARDLVRMIQNARKNADLDVSDRIGLWLTLPEAAAEAATEHQAYIGDQTLAEAIEINAGTPAEGSHAEDIQICGAAGKIALARRNASPAT